MQFVLHGMKYTYETEIELLQILRELINTRQGWYRSHGTSKKEHEKAAAQRAVIRNVVAEIDEIIQTLKN